MKKTINYFKFLSILLLGIAVMSCSKKAEKSKFDVSQIDKSVNPSEDFYHYAVGNWLKNNPVPDDQVIWAAFTELREKTNKDVKSLILEAASKKELKKGSIEEKVGLFYKIGMDTAKINSQGIAPLLPELKRVDNISNRKELFLELAHMFMYNSNPFFYFYAGQDDKNSEMMIAKIWQGGLGLPDRDYYVEDNARAKTLREGYLKHISNMLVLAGYDKKDAEKSANTIMKLETRLAKASNTRTENRNPDARYNKMNLVELKKISKGFDWDTFLAGMELENPGDINVAQPNFIKEVGKVVAKTNLNDLKTYLKWTVLRSNAGYLSDDFVNERFNFYGKVINGQKVITPRWKRVIGTANGVLGEAIGQLYVKKHFPPEAKERAKKIVDNLLVSMEKRIKQLDWMSDVTKEKALEKLSKFSVKIGYPDKWRDYSSLEIKDDSYVQNIIRSNYFDFKYNMNKIGKPVDKKEWFMTPQTVNAGYNPSQNDITFPAAILQFPFFDKDVDDAINYGAMGAVIGHEITHGFDDQGRKYDGVGNLNDWWTKEDTERFEQKTNGLVEQFNAFSPFEGFHVNGRMTLGENIADLGGLTVAFEAFKETEQYKKNEKIDGFTPAQRFFLSWANVWKNNIREEALKTRLKTDVHSPGMYRVLGPLRNMEAFINAFNIEEGKPMALPKDQRVVIW